jgi:hypothetical protein
MHWTVIIALLWFAIYLASILFAFTVKFLLPVSAFQAAVAGLAVGLFGVLYVVGARADQRLREILGDLVRLRRPTVTVDGEDDIEAIIEELEDDG